MTIMYRSGTSFFSGTLIDGYLIPEDEKALYNVWEVNPSWPAPLEYQGGVKAITCEMVLEVAEPEFLAAFGKTKASKEQAARIRKAANENAER